VTNIYLEKMEAVLKACQEQMRTETKTSLEEMKAAESEARAEHYEWVPYAEATYLSAL
jgi:hypothetical protein